MRGLHLNFGVARAVELSEGHLANRFGVCRRRKSAWARDGCIDGCVEVVARWQAGGHFEKCWGQRNF